MNVLLFFGISLGIGFSLFFGNYLYKVSGNNMIVPNTVFVFLGLFLFLPLAIKVIPDDKASELKVEAELQRKYS